MKNTHSTTQSPQRGRPRQFDRESALMQAMLLFWRKGFSATSVSDLTSSMGISSPSLYAAFGSKEDLYAEALTYYQQIYTSKLWADFDAALTAREAFESYLMNSIKQFVLANEENHPAGCMLGLSTVGNEGNAILGKIVSEAREKTLQRLDRRLEKAVAEGELSAKSATGRARFYLAVLGGISLQARDGANREELESIVRQTLSVWNSDH
ncbi:TetR/AcrR family transcriptional regulator [Vibrio porteresiae]|uniref:TetR/AcrR family transcriptional regulator n=1 Tax=Vibrio porteresiae DSM 19223 TaxID=1123496 RepID=A0ABZ0QJN5_9VIBR|nr:TetR/AcrR family transcriptional regulator [Vibrio porteresiae]WPC76221.1 TetR/AcrR family transcriptional regulator [Vibrio porteresiae DSM 19223]